jgi:guanylate kinase
MIQNPFHSHITRRGFMLVLSSPSGTGKTTIARQVLSLENELELSISTTTRPQRESEKEGKDYHFVDEKTFSQMVERKEFLEYAEVYGHHYGSPKAFVEDYLSKGVDVLFDIDWQGTQQLKEMAMSDLVSVFLLPPTFQDLEKRLIKRGEDSKETVLSRMKKANDEISHWAEYDYIVINQDLSESVNAVRSILQAERLKRRRQVGLAHFVQSLKEESVSFLSPLKGSKKDS